MTTTNNPVSFPTSSSATSGGAADFRDSTVTRATMQAHDTVDRVAESIGPVVDRVKDAAARAGELLRFRDRGLDDLQDEVLTALRQSVRKNPVGAVAIAVAFGWFLGRSGSR